MNKLMENYEEKDSLEYLKILKALVEIPFQVGKNLLIDFLKGNYKNKSIINNRLDKLHHFNSLNMNSEKISSEINKLIKNRMIELNLSNYNKFIKVLSITSKGKDEINNPSLYKIQLKNKINFKKTEITQEDKLLFKELNHFLWKFNDEQKKAIISKAQKILCLAGAGSGKTTVLTKRIEFMIKYRNISPEKILAITFTRKAKKEMEKRLHNSGIVNVKVNTFNSFCEEILRKYEDKIYKKKVRVQTYRDKILAINMALENLGLNIGEALQNYFTEQQRRLKTQNQLLNDFMNDCFLLMDYFKFTTLEKSDFYKNSEQKNRQNAKMIYQIIQYLKEHMEIQGLRDFSDQLIDALKFLKENPQCITKFDHILIDEYQDVNALQIELLKVLNPNNLFAVGDPRQSIFGWRGSDINYILNFEKDYPNCEVIHLTKNYRSSKKIVDFINKSIEEMGLPYLNPNLDNATSIIKIINFDSEDDEKIFVINKILSSEIPYNEIFVLARTNQQLLELSEKMKLFNLPHVVKNDEIRSFDEEKSRDITLATIHAIKGLEAKKVFVIGCNEQNFPCKYSEHPVIEMIKTDSYDKEEEERRLFYVAISRAKETLYLTYSGKKPTYFIKDEMKKIAV